MAVNFKGVLESRVLHFECARAHCTRRLMQEGRLLNFLLWNVVFVLKFLELDCQHLLCLAIRIYVLGNWSVEDADFCCHRCR